METRKASFAKGLVAALKEGTVTVPYLLLQHYATLKLSEVEAMLLIHILAYQEKEQRSFPTIEELSSRMHAPHDDVINALQKLTKHQFILIEEQVDPDSGIHFERYNLQPLYEKLAQCHIDDVEQKVYEQHAQVQEAEQSDIFTAFENEFGRPLSPMEYESITSWLDQDRYSEELILMALREAVFAGKLHFRYIDRILINWARQRIQTAEQARQYTQQFRNL